MHSRGQEIGDGTQNLTHVCTQHVRTDTHNNTCHLFPFFNPFVLSELAFPLPPLSPVVLAVQTAPGIPQVRSHQNSHPCQLQTKRGTGWHSLTKRTDWQSFCGRDWQTLR